MAQDLDVTLGSLSAPEGSRQTRIRRARGLGSGLGKTAGRGGKGQTARAGKGRPRGFEGGQTPLARRLPKWGFKNHSRKVYDVINLSALEAHFEAGSTVDLKALIDKGLMKSERALLKVLGEGNLTKKLVVKAHKFSKSALQKISSVGGQAQELKVADAGKETA